MQVACLEFDNFPPPNPHPPTHNRVSTKHKHDIRCTQIRNCTPPTNPLSVIEQVVFVFQQGLPVLPWGICGATSVLITHTCIVHGFIHTMVLRTWPTHWYLSWLCPLSFCVRTYMHTTLFAAPPLTSAFSSIPWKPSAWLSSLRSYVRILHLVHPHPQF